MAELDRWIQFNGRGENGGGRISKFGGHHDKRINMFIIFRCIDQTCRSRILYTNYAKLFYDIWRTIFREKKIHKIHKIIFVSRCSDKFEKIYRIILISSLKDNFIT